MKLSDEISARIGKVVNLKRKDKGTAEGPQKDVDTGSAASGAPAKKFKRR